MVGGRGGGEVNMRIVFVTVRSSLLINKNKAQRKSRGEHFPETFCFCKQFFNQIGLVFCSMRFNGE
jgi:hypothetical protein